MYTCLECLKTFDEPTPYTETHGLDSPPYECWNGCPFCAGAYTDAIKCFRCEKYITVNYIEILDGGCVCENCYFEKTLGDD